MFPFEPQANEREIGIKVQVGELWISEASSVFIEFKHTEHEAKLFLRSVEGEVLHQILDNFKDARLHRVVEQTKDVTEEIRRVNWGG